MNDRSFLAAVCASPDDDTPRLAYADWLEEADRPERAEFIRVQCELARIDGDDPRRPDLDRREQELLSAHAGEWLKSIPTWARKYPYFRRGFVNQIGVGTRTFAGKAGGLRGKAPVDVASLSNADRGGLEALAGCPHLAPLRALLLADCDIRAVGTLLDSPSTAGLVGLTFNALDHYAPRFPDLGPFLDSPHLKRFNRLGFRGIEFDPPDIVRLGHRLGPGRLEALRLESDPATDSAVREVTTSAAMRGLRTLDLGGCRHLSDLTCRAVAESPYLGGLRRLSFRHARITDDGMRLLADSPNLRELTDLDLILTGVGPAGVRRLAESPNLPRLSRIDMRYGPEFAELPIRRWVYPAGLYYGTVWVRDLRR